MVFAIDTTTPFGERAQRRLREAMVAWLTTTSEDGTPQPVPVWFLWDGADSFLLYSKPGTAKLRNIAARPRVSLNLDGNGEGGDVVVVLEAPPSPTTRQRMRCPATSRSTTRSSPATAGRPRASPPTTPCRCASPRRGYADSDGQARSSATSGRRRQEQLRRKSSRTLPSTVW